MSLSRRIAEHRPAVVLAVLVVLSVVLLGSGARGGPVSSGVRTAAGLVALPFLSAFNHVESALAYGVDLFFAYDETRQETRELRRKFAAVLQHTSERQELLLENERLRAMMAFERREPRLTLLPVEVIRSFEGMLTIDRGSVHGMARSMCVITADGVIGMITQVDLLTSNVVTLQNADCHIDAMIRRNRVRGKVHGTGNALSRVCSMEYIDLKDDVVEGDLVVTSPDSVFPSGFPIGRVTAVNPEQGPLSKSADVIPTADPFRVDEVFVLLNADLEWEELAGRMAPGRMSPVPVAFVTDELLDTKTIQERFAP